MKGMPLAGIKPIAGALFFLEKSHPWQNFHQPPVIVNLPVANEGGHGSGDSPDFWEAMLLLKKTCLDKKAGPGRQGRDVGAGECQMGSQLAGNTPREGK